ncbi:ABC transporter permease [Paenibacillus agilis]|uniref:ABC transporter permease subunit n=1 Tax=Paenibacillus agilis TaxID=3020863 RepID=A0A559IGJ7_9BACL|nr:ABC transporter permease subunit [Paenibacillus agilis]
MRNLPLWIGGTMLAFLLFVMFAGPHLPFIDKELTPEKHRWNADRTKLTMPPYKPSEKNPLGSDKAGVDNLSKLVVGAKTTVLFVLAVTLVRYLIAVPLGLLARKQKGFTYSVVTSMNQVFSFLPALFFAALLLSSPWIQYGDYRLLKVITILALLEVGRAAYVIQQQTYQLSYEPYMEAGTSLGLSNKRLAVGYYWPALLPEVLINFCIDVGKVMLLVGQLGVLSIFLTHDWVEVSQYTMQFLNSSTDWMSLLGEHRKDIMYKKFGFIFFPALAIMYVILTFNILGEGLRRYFSRQSRVQIGN